MNDTIPHAVEADGIVLMAIDMSICIGILDSLKFP